MLNVNWRKCLLITLILTLLACTADNVSTQNYYKIEEGMSINKVKEILNEPQRTEKNPSLLGETYIWENNSLLIRIQIVDNQVYKKEMQQKTQ